MERTGDDERAEAVRDDAARRAGAARARAYLDLWEQHVVLTALHGPVAPWPPTTR
jgi:hypothetical protein